MRQLRDLERTTHEEINKLDREVVLYSIDHLVAELLEKYTELLDIVAYVRSVRDDIADNIEPFRGRGEVPQHEHLPFPVPWMEQAPFRKYEVNVTVDNSDLKGAPVVYEPNPTYQYLFGRVDKEARFGALTTDFTMIRPGSIHKANGGYLVVPAEELLINILSYDGLKRALREMRITIEEPGERLGFITTKTLTPEPIPLDIKVIIIGNPVLYQQLYVLDPGFNELFKVKAEFDTTMARTQENMETYASFICTTCQKEGLRHLDPTGVAKLVEYASRLTDNQNKLTTRFGEIADILREANYYASKDDSPLVSATHVKRAIEEKVYRSNLIQEKIKEMIQRGVILISTTGEAVGQVNGLSVASLGDFTFGQPSRVTASIGLGREGVIDIERESEMGGPIHTKGVMILGGYLSEKYAQDKPLTLSARLVFEQSYGMVEGDSASSTELYALTSALCGIPIKQDLAVTGSVNQKGEVQAIGGFNEKVEGFFEVCRAKGLTGRQGVIIPESNVQNLMLKEEVVEAVRAGKFHIYSVKTVDEGIEILTGIRAGGRRGDGKFEEGTVNFLVDKRLREMAENLKEFPEVIIRKRS